MKSVLVVCMLVVTVQLCLVWSASLDVEKTFDFNNKYRRRSTTTAATTTTGMAQRTCPGNNPPPRCRTADLCTRDSECFANETCCRTYFAGQLLNSSCCVSTTRGLQCPATVNLGSCAAPRTVCGGSSACPADQICCAMSTNAADRCCVYPMCPTPITTSAQCNVAIGVCGSIPTARCGASEICCQPSTGMFACCANIENSPPFVIQ